MKFPIIVRLWLSESKLNAELTPERKRLNPKLDQQTGRYYVEIQGHDAFATAELISKDLIDLITVRQVIQSRLLSPENCAYGVYLHDGVEVTAEFGGFTYDDNADMVAIREVFITGNDIRKILDAYRLFRDGKLSLQTFGTPSKTKAA